MNKPELAQTVTIRLLNGKEYRFTGPAMPRNEYPDVVPCEFFVAKISIGEPWELPADTRFTTLEHDATKPPEVTP